MSSSPPATLQEALAQIQRTDAAGAHIQNELAQAQQQITAATPVAPVAQVISHRAKIPSPTLFGGKIGTSIVDFLEQVENQFTYYAAEFEFPTNNPANTIQFALSLVSAEVLSWYRALVASIVIFLSLSPLPPTVAQLQTHLAELTTKNTILQSCSERVQNELNAATNQFNTASKQRQRLSSASSSPSLTDHDHDELSLKSLMKLDAALSSEVYQKYRDEDRYFKCKEKSHIAKGCSKQLRLNW
jgi:hypothetical protein